MGCLFQESLPESKSDKDLDELQRKYPSYDRYYLASASIPSRRALFEELYQYFLPYADRHFLSDLKRHFHQRTWEMYLTYVFLVNDFSISSSNKGPDIKISFNGKTIWIECVACESGDGNDSVPPLLYGGNLQDFPEKKMLLRMTNSLDAKFKKYQEYVEKGIVEKNDIYIIALNRSALDHCDPGIPLILKSLFGFEYLNIPIRMLRDSGGDAEGKSFWSIRKDIVKQNGEPIPMNFFRNEICSGVSAIIYSKTSVLSSLNHPENMKDELILVHNPLAINPLDEQTFQFIDQFKDVGDKIIKV